MLSSYGADVLRIDRPGGGGGAATDLLTSHKASLVLDLKDTSSRSLFLTLVDKADVLIDPFRPGVLESLNLDPESVLLGRCPKLVVVRLTGFRRDGPYSKMAGHDINYLAVSGVLSMLGARDAPPLPPGNILADFAGGGHTAFTGILLALTHRHATGKGQVVNANMVDGVNFLSTFPRLRTKTPGWCGERGTNTLDGGSPYYACYECRDQGQYMAVGALEAPFYAYLLQGLGLKPEDLLPGKLERDDRRAWPYMREVLTQKFKTKTRKEWEEIFVGTDACCVPVLSHRELEAANYEHRPMVELTNSPGREVDTPWQGRLLSPGQGGEECLRRWLGWERGRQYELNESKGEVATSKSQISRL